MRYSARLAIQHDPQRRCDRQARYMGCHQIASDMRIVERAILYPMEGTLIEPILPVRRINCGPFLPDFAQCIGFETHMHGPAGEDEMDEVLATAINHCKSDKAIMSIAVPRENRPTIVTDDVDNAALQIVAINTGICVIELVRPVDEFADPVDEIEIVHQEGRAGLYSARAEEVFVGPVG